MIKNKSYRFFQLIALLLPVFTNAQFLSDVKVEPQPYLLMPYFDQVVGSPIKKVATITRIDTERGIKDDTLNIYLYGKDGKRGEEIRFEKNKRARIYHYKYIGPTISEWWEERGVENKYVKTGAVYHLDTDGKKLSEIGFTVSKTDTLSSNSVLYEYDKTKRLVKKKININNYMKIADEYYYTDNQLTKHIYIQNTNIPKHYMQIQYGYDPAGLLAEKKEFEIHDGVTTLLSYRYYTYLGKKLVKERYITQSNKSETTVLYRYTEDNKLEAMNILNQDSLYKNVSYQYEKGKVKKIIVITNAWNLLNGEFYIPLSNSINSMTKMPIRYEEQFKYDAKGNYVEKRSLLGNEIKRITEYQIEYY